MGNRSTSLAAHQHRRAADNYAFIAYVIPDFSGINQS